MTFKEEPVHPDAIRHSISGIPGGEFTVKFQYGRNIKGVVIDDLTNHIKVEVAKIGGVVDLKPYVKNSRITVMTSKDKDKLNEVYGKALEKLEELDKEHKGLSVSASQDWNKKK